MNALKFDLSFATFRFRVPALQPFVQNIYILIVMCVSAIAGGAACVCLLCCKTGKVLW